MELKEFKPEVTSLLMKPFVVAGNILANEADAKDTAQTIKKNLCIDKIREKINVLLTQNLPIFGTKWQHTECRYVKRFPME